MRVTFLRTLRATFPHYELKRKRLRWRGATIVFRRHEAHAMAMEPWNVFGDSFCPRWFFERREVSMCAQLKNYLDTSAELIFGLPVADEPLKVISLA